jgi:hypothetical protein
MSVLPRRISGGPDSACFGRLSEIKILSLLYLPAPMGINLQTSQNYQTRVPVQAGYDSAFQMSLLRSLIWLVYVLVAFSNSLNVNPLLSIIASFPVKSCHRFTAISTYCGDNSIA